MFGTFHQKNKNDYLLTFMMFQTHVTLILPWNTKGDLFMQLFIMLVPMWTEYFMKKKMQKHHKTIIKVVHMTLCEKNNKKVKWNRASTISVRGLQKKENVWV